MAEEIENVTEEVTEQPTENTIDESKFQSAGDDSIIKVDLSKPPTQKSEEVKRTWALNFLTSVLLTS